MRLRKRISVNFYCLTESLKSPYKFNPDAHICIHEFLSNVYQPVHYFCLVVYGLFPSSSSSSSAFSSLPWKVFCQVFDFVCGQAEHIEWSSQYEFAKASTRTSGTAYFGTNAMMQLAYCRSFLYGHDWSPVRPVQIIHIKIRIYAYILSVIYVKYLRSCDLFQF